MGKAIIYSENSHAAEVFGSILVGEGYDSTETKESVAFCGVDAEASLQLINAGENFDAAVKLAEKLTLCTCGAVILVGDAENCAQYGARLRENGVIVVEKPLSRQLFIQSVHDACALRGRIRRMSTQLDEARKIARAKLLLVEKQHMSEQEAHKYIEKEAMNRRITRLQMANELIESNA